MFPNKQATPSNRLPGFTLVEILVAILVSSILIAATVSTYSVFRRSLTNDQNKAELSQDARVVFDRISREIRQTPDIVTIFPSSPSDSSVPEPGEIEFEDGHAQDLTYHRYYVSGGKLELDTIEYYFSYDPTHRVHWNSVGTGGVAPVMNVISTQDVADHMGTIAFYGTKPLQIIVTTTDGGTQTFELRTSIFERNT